VTTMGTKNNPGEFDCYKAAHPDEPMFILLGRDPMAGALVREWVGMRRARKEDEKKLVEAEGCACQMDEWAKKLGKNPIGNASATLEAEAQMVFRSLEIASIEDEADAKRLGVLFNANHVRSAIRTALRRAYEKGQACVPDTALASPMGNDRSRI
jgi:hypothetical protein